MMMFQGILVHISQAWMMRYDKTWMMRYDTRPKHRPVVNPWPSDCTPRITHWPWQLVIYSNATSMYTKLQAGTDLDGYLIGIAFWDVV